MNDDRNTVFTPEYEDAWVRECNCLLKDQEYREVWQKHGYDRVKRFTSSAVAEQIHHYFQDNIWREIQ